MGEPGHARAGKDGRDDEDPARLSGVRPTRLRRQLLASSAHEPGSSFGSALCPSADRDYVYPVGTRSSDAHSSMNIGNLFTAAEPPAQGERFEELLSCRNLRIERIVSSSSIVSSEYNQEQDEWVALLRGEATLDIAGERVEFRAGDHVFLPARTPHTLFRASQGALWLASHLQ
jgi:cupin 2 domain-containing protein